MGPAQDETGPRTGPALQYVLAAAIAWPLGWVVIPHSGPFLFSSDVSIVLTWAGVACLLIAFFRSFHELRHHDRYRSSTALLALLLSAAGLLGLVILIAVAWSIGSAGVPYGG